MKNLKNIFLVFFTLTFISSCESYVEDLNDDPNRPVDSDAVNILEGVILSNQFWQSSDLNRIAMIWLDQATGADRQYIALNNWNNITAQDFSDTWNEAYVGTITQAKIGGAKAEASQNKILQGVFQVLEAHSSGMIAALWGDVPFSEVNNPAIKNPKYDPQTSVYQGVQLLLDKAISNLNSGSGSISAAKDFVYKGNAAKWATLAHSLKAKFYLHVKNYPLALIEARLGISSATDDFKANFGTTYGQNFNPFYSFLVYDRVGYMDASDAYAFELLDTTSPNYRGNSKTDESARSSFNYYPSAIYGTGAELNFLSIYDWDYPDGKFGTESNMPLVTLGEMFLIIAECEARINGLTAGVTAYNTYRQLLSLGYSIGIDDSGYFGSLKYDDYADADFNNGGIENPDNIQPIDAFYRELYEERYIYFNGSFESFIDFGRSNNIAEIQLRTGISGTPQRFIYPQVEINSNTSTPSPLPNVTEKTPVHQ